MSLATNQINKIKVSELENLEIGEEISLENDVSVYGFTKTKIFDSTYLVFGIYGGCSIITEHVEWLNSAGYELFVEKINKEFDINLELIFDIEIGLLN